MASREGWPPAYMIWDHDDALLQQALAFYSGFADRTGSRAWADVQALLAADAAPAGIGAGEWPAVRAAHAGFQAATDILLLLPFIAADAEFHALRVEPDLSIHIPDALLDADHQAGMAKVLVPPPAARADEFLAASGGMYYPREAPGAPAFVEEGQHVKAGDPLYIVEVMKMFNRVYAPFSGTIEKVLVHGEGVIIKKGQPLFKVNPDEKVEIETPEQTQRRRRDATAAFLATLEGRA
ncbi:MAG: biotin/lipoyl-containing protein, partial [Gammaproteobacteria bacterium]